MIYAQIINLKQKSLSPRHSSRKKKGGGGCLIKFQPLPSQRLRRHQTQLVQEVAEGPLTTLPPPLPPRPQLFVLLPPRRPNSKLIAQIHFVSHFENK